MLKTVPPSGWNKIALDHVAEVQTGLAKGKVVNGASVTLPYLRVANVQDGHVNLSVVKEITLKSSEVDRYSLRKGDVLFTEGGDFDKLGRGTVWNGEIEPCLHQNHVFAVRPNPDRLLPEFLAFQAACEYGRHYFQLSSKQSTNLASINSTQLKQFPVLLPPLAEQRKIAKILRTWDEAIERLEAQQMSKDSRYKALARRFFDPCHPTFHGRPNAWRELELGEVFRERNESGEDSDRLLSITMNGGVIDREDVGRKDTSTEDKSKYKLILPGDIGYNTMRMWQGVSGLSALRGIISPAYTVVTPVAKQISGRYAVHLFKSRRMVFDFERYSQGLTSDTWNLKFAAFSKIKVFLPPIEEQDKQADLLDALTAESVVIGKQREAVSRQKRGLMQRLLTGEWRVKVEAS
jgi:type I restriction enzyme S subunit